MKQMTLSRLPSKPLVSIIVANYNYGRYLQSTLESAFNQTYPDVEVIVCDDGSTDDSLAVLDRLSNRSSQLRIVTQENRGQGAALSGAFKESKGDIICILDSDDEFDASKVEKVVSAAKDSAECGMFTHPVSVIDEHSRLVRRRPIPSQLDSGFMGEAMLTNGLTCAIPPASGISFRRDVAERIFPIPQNFRQLADGFVCRCAALITAIAAHPEPLARYRIHGRNMTGITVKGAADLDRQCRLFEELVFCVCEWYRNDSAIELQTDRILARCVPFVESRLALSLAPEGPAPRAQRDVVIEHEVVRSRIRRMAWSLLTSIPRPMAWPLLRFWWGNSMLKRVLQSVAGA